MYSDTANYIYKVDLDKVNGGKTKGIISTNTNGENTPRLYFHRCHDTNIDVSLLRLSYLDIIQRPYFMKDSMRVYKLIFDLHK
jgi:hypothetical protein